MKRNILSKFFAPLLFVFIFVGCDNAIDEENWMYLGSWGSDKYILEIWQCGEARFAKSGRYDYDGYVKITDDKIVFRSDDGVFTKRLTINTEPTFDDELDIEYMELDGDRYNRH